MARGSSPSGRHWRSSPARRRPSRSRASRSRRRCRRSRRWPRSSSPTARCPALAIAVVHDDEVVYLGGFGLREVGKPGDRRRRHRVPDRLDVEADLGDRRREAGQRRRRRLGQPHRRPRTRPSALHDPYPTAEVTRHRPLQPPQRPARHPRRRPRGDRLRPRRRSCARLRLVPPSSSFRAGYAYSQRRPHPRGARRGDADRASPGRRWPRSGSTGRSA